MAQFIPERDKSQNTYCYTVDTIISDEFSSFSGVKQGKWLSPFLFSVYLNDLENDRIQKGANGFYWYA